MQNSLFGKARKFTRFAVRWITNNRSLRPVVSPIWLFLDILFAYLGISVMAHPGKDPSRMFLAVVAFTTRRVHGPRTIKAGPDDLIAVCRVRNGEEYVRVFIEHHLDLGVEHIVFLDNDSKDETVPIACEYEQVSILRNPLSFRTYSRVFNAYLRERCAQNRWCLCLDVDELFDYPHSDQVSIQQLLRYLKGRSFNVVLANMLEMFADAPFKSLEKDKCRPDFKKRYCYYDLQGIISKPIPLKYRRGTEPMLRQLMGGIRKTGFGQGGPLYKFPLFILNTGLGPTDLGNHDVLGGNPRIADFTCVLYHYQFTGSLRERCNQAVRENQYAHGSSKYRAFLDVLNREPDLNLKEKALQPQYLCETRQLIEEGFLRVSDEFNSYVLRDRQESPKGK